MAADKIWPEMISVGSEREKNMQWLERTKSVQAARANGQARATEDGMAPRQKGCVRGG